MLILPPNHLVHNPRIGLDDLDDFGGDVFVDVVRDGRAVVAGSVHRHGGVHGLQQAAGVDAGNEEARLVERLGALGRRADAYRRERMADRGKKGRFLREGSGVGDHCEGVHLQAVVVVEAKGLVADDPRVQLEARGFQPLPRARMARVQYRHVVFLRHRVDGIEETQEVLLSVDILLPVGGQQDILALLKSQPGVDVRGLDLREILMQYFRHRRAGHVCALLREPAVCQVTAGVLRIRHVHVGDDVHDAAVGLLRQALVLAAVASFHVEDRDVQPLRAYHAQAAVGIAQHEHGIRLHSNHQLVALVDDIAHRLAEVRTHGIHVDIRIGKLQVLEEHAVEIVVIVLACMGQQAIEILPALVDDCRQPDDFRPRAYNDKKLQFPVILELCHKTNLFYWIEICIRM